MDGLAFGDSSFFPLLLLLGVVLISYTFSNCITQCNFTKFPDYFPSLDISSFCLSTYYILRNEGFAALARYLIFLEVDVFLARFADFRYQ